MKRLKVEVKPGLFVPVNDILFQMSENESRALLREIIAGIEVTDEATRTHGDSVILGGWDSLIDTITESCKDKWQEMTDDK